ncbi:hypothetical protein [Allomuricauda sp. d1]|uniref:hypothetical protein n=1 Tax=Allomuricauda sp. d1 TaxID=3136725 RepID=UPI0031DE759B
MKLTKRNRLIITLVITVLVWAHVLWDYTHGGIPVHYLFMNENMPPFPNWLGAIILPFFTWVLLYRIHKRVDAPDAKDTFRLAISRFFTALVVAGSIAICFELGIEIPGFVLLGILGLGVALPLYKSEFLLGWVLGLSYTFGAMIPMLFAIVLAGVLFLFYKLGRAVVGLFKAKKA